MSNLGTNNSNCPQLAELYQELTTLKSSFDADLTRAQTIIKNKDVFSAKLAIKDAKDKRENMEKIIYEIQETMFPLDKLMNFNEQYETQKSVLTELGDLEKLSNGQLGIKGIDPTDPLNPAKTKEYIFPSKADIRKRLFANRELYQLKMNQGFTRLLITPFALPLDKLADKYGKELVKKYQANGDKLYSAGPDPYDPSTDLKTLTTLSLKTTETIWTYDALKQTDINGQLKYFPKRINKKDHSGHTKSEILANPSAGFEVALLPQNPITTVSNANKTPRQYLTLTQTTNKKSIYYCTHGQTPEGILNLNRQTLHRTNQVLGDYEGNDKANLCVSAYLAGFADVLCLFWYRDCQRVHLYRYSPVFGSSIAKLRPVVRVL